MDLSLVFLTLPSTQSLLQMPLHLNSLSVLIDDPREQPAVVALLRQSWGEEYEILSWQQMMPEVVQGIEVDNASGVIMILILYVVIGFGMFGTTMMMTLERRREFGILLAVGMQRVRLALVTLTESLFLSFLGITLGSAAGFPLLVYLYHHPIRLHGDAAAAMLEFGFEPVVPFSLDPAIFWSQGYVVLLLAAVCAAYPALVLHRLDPVAAMRS
jgi:ABC-type lipoprotein release transport system permease subunit